MTDTTTWNFKGILKFLIFFIVLGINSTLYGQGPIVINEINYRSVEVQSNIDFVELHNVSANSVNISNWILTNGINYVFPSGTSIPSGGYLVVAADPANCQAVLGFSNAYGPYSSSLSSEDDLIELRDNAFVLVDLVEYASWDEWPSVRHLNDGDSPVSIQKIHPLLNGNHGGSWSSNIPTPNAQNTSVYQSNHVELPIVKKVSKTPNNPTAGVNMLIEAELKNLSGILGTFTVTLEYQAMLAGSYIGKSTAAYATNWTPIPMLDNGVGADPIAADGIFSAHIPANIQVHRSLVRYRVKIQHSNGYGRTFPDQNHEESNYAYYVYNGHANFNGYSFAGLPDLQEMTVITTANHTELYMGDGGPNTNQYQGKSYLGEGAMIYQGKVYDHIRFRPRGSGSRRDRVKPGLKFDMNNAHSFSTQNDCGELYKENRGKLRLSGGWVNDIAGHGITESIVYKVLELAGGLSRNTDYAQLRIVDSSTETGNAGDFWGLFLIQEDFNGNYLKEHQLAEGNFWQTERPVRDRTIDYLGDFPGSATTPTFAPQTQTNGSFTINSLGHLDLLFGDKIAAVSNGLNGNNYIGKHSYMEYYDSGTSLHHGWWGDFDNTFGSPFDDVVVFPRSQSNSSAVYDNDMLIPATMLIDFQSRFRSFYDLFLNVEQREYLVDKEAEKIFTPGVADDWAELDHSRWLQTYDLTTFDNHVNWYKTWFSNRSTFIANDATHGILDVNIPSKPTVSLIGSNALDNLTFSNSSYQGVNGFAALEWRVGEWSDPNNPAYSTDCEPIYEAQTKWQSGEITSFTSSYTIPADANLEAGKTYKFRVRYKDATGRWSHWSAPQSIVPTPAVNYVGPNLVINEILYDPTLECGQEYLELYNNTPNTVALKNFQFTEGITYHFPASASLPGYGYYLIARDSIDFFHKYGFYPDGEYRGALSNTGEEIILTGPFNVLIDNVAYSNQHPWDLAASDDGRALELLNPFYNNNNPLNWFRSDDACGTPGSVNSRICTGTAPAIVINEIHYNPAISNDPGEWVELHNPGSTPINLSGWTLYDNTNKFIFPSNTIMEGGDFLVLVNDPVKFAAKYPEVTNFIGTVTFGLKNDGERISLFNGNKCLSDYVVYDDSAPWTTGPDGFGPTLSLITPNSNNTLASSWESSSNINAPLGTPGRANEACPTYTITGAATACRDTPAQFSINTPPGARHEWTLSGNNQILGTSATETFTFATTGIKAVVVTSYYYECETSTVFIVNVQNCNTNPNAVNDAFTTLEDGYLAENVLINDTDAEGDNLSITVQPADFPTNGTFSYSVNGGFTYLPDLNFYGTDSFTYEVCDDGIPLLCDQATVTITVNSVNDAPIALDNTRNIVEDTPANRSVLNNDSDIDGNLVVSTLSLITTPPASEATVTINGNGTIRITPAPNFNGTVSSFTYEICDNGSPVLCDQADVFVIVSAVNDQPLANNDSYSGNEDQTISGNVMTNDSDIEGDALSSTIVNQPSNGSLTLNASGSFVYTPVANYNGTDSFSYEVCDDGSPVLCDQTTVILTVNPVNDTPVAVADSETTQEDQSVSSTVATNDSDVDGGNLTYTSLLQPQSGSLSFNANGTYTYQPIANFHGSDSFTYEVCDNGNPSLCANATVSIIVNPVNDSPTAVADSETTQEDQQLSSTVATNDNDVDGDNLLFTAATLPQNGTLSFNANGTYSYQPILNYHGPDSFTYEICDDGTPSLCANATVTINVNSVNDSPVAAADWEITLEDQPLSSTAATNDSDVDGDNLVFSVVVQTQNGTLSFNANGSYTYTPNTNYNGVDSFSYEVCDDGTPVLCANNVVTISVEPTNDGPIAIGDTQTLQEDQQGTGDVSINDSDVDNGILTFSSLQQPQNGSLSLNADGTFTYQPISNYHGPDSFTYQACDDGTPALCATATVTLTINPVNDTPVAVADSENTQEDQLLSSTVASNDSDIDGDDLTYSVLVQPQSGTLSFNANGSYSYTPNADYNGADSFSYETCDDGTPVLCASNVVSISVQAVNDDPVAIADSNTTQEDQLTGGDVSINDYDTDSGVLTFSVVQQPQNGSLVFNSDGTYVYTPNANFHGVDIFTYQACDNGTPSLCTSATVALTVNSVNDSPVAIADTENIQEDQQLSSTVATNDSDVDGDNLSFNNLGQPQNGTLSFNVNGSYSYTPNADFNGTDGFQYEVCDNASPSLCASNTVTITVAGVNDEPVALSDLETVAEDQQLLSDVSVNDYDVEGNALSYSSTSFPQNGSLVFLSDGMFTYTPVNNYNGADSFSYQVCDNGIPSQCSNSTVNITVSAVNDAPFVISDQNTLLEDQPVSGNVGVNDSDIEGQNLSFFAVSAPQNGNITLNIDGTYTYEPNPNYFGADQFTYEACDDDPGQILCSSTTVNLTITPVNDAPVLLDDSFIAEENETIQGTVLTNDFDLENDLLTVNSSPIFNGVGSLNLNIDGTFTYVPVAGFFGIETFVYEVCDNAVPSLCNQATVSLEITEACVELEIFAFLEGAFNEQTDLQNTTLNALGLLPGMTNNTGMNGQPYNAPPWNYTGTEGTGWTDQSYDPDVVDWVVLSLRTGPQKSTEVLQAAGLLYKDGHIEMLETCFPGLNGSQYYIVVEHRNHAGVMTPSKVSIVNKKLTWDFRIQDSYATFSFGQKQVKPGIFTMFAGDGSQIFDNISYDITGIDKEEWSGQNGFFDVYDNSDFNLDGDINGFDKKMWSVNNGVYSRVPR